VSGEQIADLPEHRVPVVHRGTGSGSAGAIHTVEAGSLAAALVRNVGGGVQGGAGGVGIILTDGAGAGVWGQHYTMRSESKIAREYIFSITITYFQ
jgi:hypothetical protein